MHLQLDSINSNKQEEEISVHLRRCHTTQTVSFLLPLLVSLSITTTTTTTMSMYILHYLLHQTFCPSRRV